MNQEYMDKYWDGRHYYSLNAWLKSVFGTKVYKLSLEAGMSCPNRDGKVGTGGCISAAREDLVSLQGAVWNRQKIKVQ